MAACIFAVRCGGIRRSGAGPAAGRAGIRRACGCAQAETQTGGKAGAQAGAEACGRSCKTRRDAGDAGDAAGRCRRPAEAPRPIRRLGAYTASPGGKKICFAISKPVSAVTDPPNRPRNPIYMFVSTRPADKVTNEVSIIVGYPFKPGSEASAQIGSTGFALYTQQDGAWIKNAAEEVQMVNAMRGGDTVVVKGESAKGTKTTDTYNLRGVAQALDRTAQECK